MEKKIATHIIVMHPDPDWEDDDGLNNKLAVYEGEDINRVIQLCHIAGHIKKVIDLIDDGPKHEFSKCP